MLDSLEVKNFTVFPDARLGFARGLNVIVGENGLGKTHLLKLPYAVMVRDPLLLRHRLEPGKRVRIQAD